MRINKFLAKAGICSRREADKLIADRKVTINDHIATLGDQVRDDDIIKVNGKAVAIEPEKIYIAYHKPYGVISTTDPQAENNIISQIDIKKRIFPVGRLDVQSSGLILLTNDGEIVNKISKAEHHHEKEYLVTVDKPLTPDFLRKMAVGVHIFHRKTLPAKIKKISSHQFGVILVQGMNKQIRRMCETLGYEVKILKRIRVMNILLGDLPRGKWRFLSETEKHTLLNSLEHESKSSP